MRCLPIFIAGVSNLHNVSKLDVRKHFGVHNKLIIWKTNRQSQAENTLRRRVASIHSHTGSSWPHQVGITIPSRRWGSIFNWDLDWLKHLLGNIKSVSSWVGQCSATVVSKPMLCLPPCCSQGKGSPWSLGITPLGQHFTPSNIMQCLAFTRNKTTWVLHI